MKYILGFIAIIAGVIFSGFALSILWEWFAVTAFNLPSLSVVEAMGLCLVAQYVTHQPNWNEESPRLGIAVAYSLIKPTTALIIGSILTLFM